MAFDLARYNLQPYNASGEKTRKISVSITETVSASIGTASMISPLAIINERVNQRASGELTRKIRPVKITETVNELVVEALASVIVNMALDEIISTESDVSANIDLQVNVSEAVTEETDVKANILLSPSITEEVEANADISAVISANAEIYELVDETASLDALDLKICNIGTTANRLTLKPGQRLIINAIDYNVLLDGENAIWYQSGEWIDELTRETVSIAITAASGARYLSATILYTERYL